MRLRLEVTASAGRFGTSTGVTERSRSVMDNKQHAEEA